MIGRGRPGVISGSGGAGCVPGQQKEGMKNMKKKFQNGVTNYEEYKADFIKENKQYLQRQAVIDSMAGKKDLTLAEEVALVQCIGVSELSGKLKGFWAVSTSVLKNARCQARARVHGCICKDCYAAAGASRYDGLALVLDINFQIMNRWRISAAAWATLQIPSINCKARIESHGDVATVCAAVNNVRIIKSHPWLTFGVWTKNADLYKAAFKEEGGKPANMVFLVSSPMENEVFEVPEDLKQYVDHVFTVYTPAYIAEHGIVINCGGRKCADCMRCYTLGNTDYYISEQKK